MICNINVYIYIYGSVLQLWGHIYIYIYIYSIYNDEWVRSTSSMRAAEDKRVKWHEIYHDISVSNYSQLAVKVRTQIISNPSIRTPDSRNVKVISDWANLKASRCPHPRWIFASRNQPENLKDIL